MAEHIRYCCNPACREEITASFGFVLARDTLAAHSGLIPWTRVREHCGKCAAFALLHEDIAMWYLALLPWPEPEFA